MRFCNLLTALWLCAAVASGCASGHVIPDTLESQVDKQVTFDQLKQSPENYEGKLVVLGGQVLKATRLKDGTQLEILELPLRKDRPILERSQSQGRFLAIEREFLDPATLVEGVPVTIVGAVTGSTTQSLDQTEYRYPTLDIKYLKVWDEVPGSGYGRPYGPWWSIFGGVGTGGGTRGGIGMGIGF
jgi:outer membrane lipoprotein